MVLINVFGVLWCGGVDSSARGFSVGRFPPPVA